MDSATVATDGSSLPDAASTEPGALFAGRAVLITVAFFTVQVVAGAAIGIAIGVYYGLTRGLTQSVMTEMQHVVVLSAALVGTVLGGVSALLLTKRAVRGSLGSDGLIPLGWCPARGRDVLTGAIVGAMLAAGYLLVGLKIRPAVPGQHLGLLARAAASGGWQRAIWASVALLAPPVEEFVFRGVLWTGLRRSFGAFLAGGGVTILFVGSHATEALGYWPAWAAITAVCVATILFRARTGSLVPAVAVHAVYNATLVLWVYLAAA